MMGHCARISWYPRDKTGEARSADFQFGSVITVGRDSGCDIILQDKEVSRKHAHVEIRDSEAIVTDLKSANGTRVGDNYRVESVSWRMGQFVQIGNYVLEIEFVPRRAVAVT